MTEAFDKGIEAYAEKELSDNPYEKGSAEHRQWESGWKRAEQDDPLAPCNMTDDDTCELCDLPFVDCTCEDTCGDCECRVEDCEC